MKTKARKTHARVSRVTEGSGNVFADLGLPNPEQELLKARLTLQIYTILKGSGMTQVEIAKILGVGAFPAPATAAVRSSVARGEPEFLPAKP